MNSPLFLSIFSGGFAVFSLIGLGLYLHARKRIRLLEKSIQSRDLFLEAVIQDTVDSIYLKDPQHRILFANDHFIESIGRTREGTIGFTDKDFFGKKFGQRTFDQENRILETGKSIINEIENRSLSAGETEYTLTTKVPVYRDGIIKGILGITREFNSLAKVQEELEHNVNHDALTGLYNRTAIKQALLDIVQNRRPVAILFIDIDNFKYCNDQFGHDFGDEILKMVAVRLQDTLRKDDLIGRLGGDEFIVILRRIANKKEAESATQKLLARFLSPFEFDGNTAQLSLSVGVVCTNMCRFTQATTPKDVLRFADEAMYEAKKLGKGQYKFYTCESEE